MAQDQMFAGIDRRITQDREEGDIAYFNALMLKLEFLTKVVTAGVVACISDDIDRHRYTLEHKLVRANSLGEWTEILNTALVGPPAQSLDSEAREIAKDLTQRVDQSDWRFQAVSSLHNAATELGATSGLGEKIALRRFFDIGAQVRNRTRGHGATTATQCQTACSHLVAALDAVVSNMVILKLPWVHLHQNLSKKYRVSPLLNDPAPFEYLKGTRDMRLRNGVYINLGTISDALNPQHVRLIFTGTELHDIALPNGNFKKKTFETLSYVTNDVDNADGAEWSHPPAGLPQSETEGNVILELMGNMFANVPVMPSGYVPRPILENQLIAELRTTERHPIVTLTGPGGIGKTTVAIKAIHDLSELNAPPYEVVLWISARDIDLLDEGPKPVSQRVFSQIDISGAAVALLEPAERKEGEFDSNSFFQNCLAEGAAGTTLFVLDNFETLQNPVDVYEWLDAHIRPPNKVLITTRFRDFRGDYPIRITGMLDDEANELITQHAKQLGILHLVSASYRKELITESEGHPYVIKILLGQAAKERKAGKPRRIVATADHLLNALFKRTYDALSLAAQRVFLLLCSWRVYVPEVAVQAVSLRPGTERFDVASALEEAIQFSLIDQVVSEDGGERFVGVPLAAAIFGQRELQASRFKIAVEEDLKLLRGFGAGKRESASKGVVPRIHNLIGAIASRIDKHPDKLNETLPVLEYLARRYPATYLRLVDLVLETSKTDQALEAAKLYLRSFLETAHPTEKREAWERLADLCKTSGDPMGEVHALCEMALLPTSNHLLLGKIANRLNSRVRELKEQGIDEAWSSEARELLLKVIKAMEQKLDILTATYCSRLAWLHLNVGNQDRAIDIARIGLKKEPDNTYCLKLMERLES